MSAAAPPTSTAKVTFTVTLTSDPRQPYRVLTVPEAAPLAAELDLLLGDVHFSALVERLRASSEWCPPSRRDAGDGDAVGYLMW